MSKEEHYMKKFAKILIIILAVLGVLFLVLMFLPDDDDSAEVNGQASEETQADGEASAVFEIPESQGQGIAIAGGSESEGTGSENTADPADTPATGSNGAAVTVSIPDSELSEGTISFKTTTLDGSSLDESIFSDYDITVVHVWGTFCGPCIAEMGDYAAFYKEIPSNVNLIGVVCDVYDGLDNNVDSAYDILNSAGAGFTNLRTSDSIYNVTASFQYVPSSFFVDSNGHVIGEMLDGASFEDTITRLNSYLE